MMSGLLCEGGRIVVRRVVGHKRGVCRHEENRYQNLTTCAFLVS